MKLVRIDNYFYITVESAFLLKSFIYNNTFLVSNCEMSNSLSLIMILKLF